MKRTICTLAVGNKKYLFMALAMMQSAREHCEESIDRYVIFTDGQKQSKYPDWIEFVVLQGLEQSSIRYDYWQFKPALLGHPAIANDLVLFVDADSTIYTNVIGDCFDWMEQFSLLLYLQWREEGEMWGKFNLGKVYRDAGFKVRNLTINSGIVGKKPDQLGNAFQENWQKLMDSGVLKGGFTDEMSIKNDEPYAGLAYQLAHIESGVDLPARANPFKSNDYVITVGADRSMFSRQPGPVVRVPWCSHDFIKPAIVHWVDQTNSWFYHKTVWINLFRGKLLRGNIVQLALSEISDLFRRLKIRLTLKFEDFQQRGRDGN